MKNWNSLLIRHGFLLEEKSGGTFDCQRETRENLLFLQETLKDLFVDYSCSGNSLSISSPFISEGEWLEAVDLKDRGRTELLQFGKGVQIPHLKDLDTYIAGVVRQLNRMNFNTKSCCDGHSMKYPRISFIEEVDFDKLRKVLNSAGITNIHVHKQTVIFKMSRHGLLDVAEHYPT